MKVVDLEDDALVLTAPYDHNGYPILLTPGSRVIIGYVHTAYFSFETSVREQIAGRTPLIIVEKPQPSQISKEQRRQSFRVPVTLRARVTTNHTDWFEVNLLDLSAGGFRAAMTHARLHIGDELAGELTLPLERGAATVSFEGEVTRKALQGIWLCWACSFSKFTRATKRSSDTVWSINAVSCGPSGMNSMLPACRRSKHPFHQTTSDKSPSIYGQMTRFDVFVLSPLHALFPMIFLL